MSVRKQILTALITMVLASATLVAAASAQCTNGGPTGSTRIGIAVASDQSGSMPVTTSYNVDLFSRFRISTLSMFSWGRGPVGHPGTVRSSSAVLRERLGLKR